MTDHTLREALTNLCDDADRARSITGTLNKAAWGNGDLTTAQVRGLLEMHPEPAGLVVTEEAIEAANQAALAKWQTGSADTTQMLLCVHAALAAVLRTRPVAEVQAEALVEYAEEHFYDGDTDQPLAGFAAVYNDMHDRAAALRSGVLTG
jgi:hypothetical protein